MLLIETASLLSEQSFIALYQHLIRLGIWAIISIIFGLIVIWQKWDKPFWQNFGLQCAVWGLIDGIIVLFGLHNQSRPDILAAVKLREFLWLNEGLDMGYLALGITLVLIAKNIGDSPRLLGAGSAVAIQGFALLLLDTILIWQLPTISDWLAK